LAFLLEVLEGVVGREEVRGAEFEGVGILDFGRGSRSTRISVELTIKKRVCLFLDTSSFFHPYNHLTMNNVVGKYIKEIREQQGLTQEQLAIRIEMAGWQVDRFVVSKIERGDRQVSDMETQLIAKVLKVSVAKLFGEE